MESELELESELPQQRPLLVQLAGITLMRPEVQHPRMTRGRAQ